MTKHMTNFRLIITPAIRPEDRHEIEEALRKLGYDVTGGGTMIDMSHCDISFRKGEAKRE